MTMQLFSFGHPCEHQLRRTCIGGSSCPLNGYPDMWCCSFIKGKINFKRDKPCEGPRCRWGFTHPTQAQFDAVTNVLNESRPIAATLDDAEDDELLTFQIDNQHVVDTVLCTLHMMKHPPSTCAKRVGELLAYAAVKMREPKVFMQLLKTMKKPVDGYILGAYFYLTNGNNHANSHLLTSAANTNTAAAGGAAATGSSSNTHASNAASGSANSTSTNATKGNKKQQHGNAGNKDRKDDVTEDLKNDMVDLMNAALSQGGHLVDREDQHHLQAVFLQALKHYPKSNRKRTEMYEAAMAKFGIKSTRTSANKVDSQRDDGNSSNNNNNTNVEPSSHLTPSAAPSSSIGAANNTTTTTVNNSGLEIKESGKKSSQAHKRDKTASQRNENKEHHAHTSANHVSTDRDETESKAIDEKISQRGSNINNLSSNVNNTSSTNVNNSPAGKTVHAKSSSISSNTIDNDRRGVISKAENDTRASDSVNSKNANVNSAINNNSSNKIIQEELKRDKAATTAVVVKPNSSQITTPRLRRSPAAKPINLKTPQNDLVLDDLVNSTTTMVHGKDKASQSNVSNTSLKFASAANSNNNSSPNENLKPSGLSTRETGDARGDVHVSNATSPEKSSLRETSLHSSKTQTPLPPSSSSITTNKKTPNSSLTSVGNNNNNNSTPKNALVESANRHSPSLQSSSITLASNTSVHNSGIKTNSTKKVNHLSGQTLSNKRSSRPYDENEVQDANYIKDESAEEQQTYESTSTSLHSHKMSTQHGHVMTADKVELTDTAKQQTSALSPPPPTKETIQQEICRISKLAELLRMMPAPELTYDPIRTDLPLPEVFLFGGQFALTVAGGKFAPLGMASTRMKLSNGSNVRSPEMKFNEHHEINNNSSDNDKGMMLGQEEQEEEEEELQEEEDDDDDDVQQGNPFFISDIDNVMTSAEALNTISSNSNMFADDLAYNGMSTEPMFENLDTAELLKDIAEGWASEEYEEEQQ